MKDKLRIALVSHDARKRELIDWVAFNAEFLSKHELIATGTTGKLIESLSSETGLICDTTDNSYTIMKVEFPFTVTKVKSGPLGGDQIIGGMIASGDVDMLIFFCDNLITQGHQTDISALTRLASLYNIPFATNRTTADMIVSSPLIMDPLYEPKPTDFSKYINRKTI